MSASATESDPQKQTDHHLICVSKDCIEDPPTLLDVLRRVGRARLELLLDEDGRLLIALPSNAMSEVVVRGFRHRLEEVPEV